MHFAASNGKTKVATLLINSGANLDVVDVVSIKYFLYCILVMSAYITILDHFNIIIKLSLTIII